MSTPPRPESERRRARRGPEGLLLALVLVLAFALVLAAAGPARAEEERPSLEVHARWLSGPQAEIARLLPDARTGRLMTLEKPRALALLQAVRAGRLRVEAAPRLLVRDGEEAAVDLSTRRAYVARCDVRRVGDVPVADPVVDTWAEGLAIHARPALMDDGQRVLLEGRWRIVGAERPIPVEEVRVPGLPSPLRIEVPDVRGHEGAFGATVPLGGYAAVAPLPHPTAPGRHGVLLLGVRRLRPPPPPPVASGGGALITVEAHLLTLAAALAPRDPGADGDRATVLHPDAAAALLAAAREHGTVLAVPRLTLLAGEDGETSLLEAVPYVHEGLRLSLRARPGPLGLRLDARATLSKLRPPLAERALASGEREAGARVPEVATTTVRGRVVVPPGGAVLLGPLRLDHADPPRWVLVRPAAVAGLFAPEVPDRSR